MIYNVTAFFLQLIALRLIGFKTLTNKQMICECNMMASGKYKFEDPLSWKGMVFHTAKRGGHQLAFEEVIENHCKVSSLLEEETQY